MNFRDELEKRTESAEQVIGKFLPAEEGFSKNLIKAMNYSMEAGGKRLRPIFLGEMYQVCGGEGELAEPFMAAIEMIHTHSLIHDDLPAMDNDDLRRGQPTLHKAFNEATAILAGDGLLTLAFDIIAQPKNKLSEKIQINLIRKLTKAAGIGGMVGGQFLDIEGEQIKKTEQDQK